MIDPNQLKKLNEALDKALLKKKAKTQESVRDTVFSVIGKEFIMKQMGDSVGNVLEETKKSLIEQVIALADTKLAELSVKETNLNNKFSTDNESIKKFQQEISKNIRQKIDTIEKEVSEASKKADDIGKKIEKKVDRGENGKELANLSKKITTQNKQLLKIKDSLEDTKQLLTNTDEAIKEKIANYKVHLKHKNLEDIWPDDHHKELHLLESHPGVQATTDQLNTLVDGSDAIRLHTHSDLKNILISGGGRKGAWGSIGGTLSAQTDLQTALDLKAPLASPTFTTQIITPLIIGGTSTTADLTLQTTSGVGATGADMHFLVGNNGATEAMTILNNGNVGIGTTGPDRKLDVLDASNPQMRLTYTDGSVYTDFQTNSSGQLVITPSGTTPLVDIAGYLQSDETVNQSATPSIYGSQTASTLQDGSAYTGTDATMSIQYIAVKFTASDAHTMGDYTIRIKESANITNTTAYLTGYIYADDGGSPSKPTGSALATGISLKFGTITSSYQTLSVGTQYTMTSGNTYWLVLKWSETPTVGNIVLDSDVSSNMGATSTDGSTWTNTDVRLRYVIRGRTYYGVSGSSTNSYGVSGSSTNSYGIYGNSTNSVGVRGISTNSYGIYGDSTSSIGVYGNSTNSVGVRGISTSSIGVSGVSTTNKAGYFYRNNTAGTATTAVVDIIQDSATSETNTVLRVQGDGTGDLVNIFDGGTEVFTILDGGNVGIGDTSPDYPLEILSTTSPQFAITHTDASIYATFGVNASGDLTIASAYSDADMYFGVNDGGTNVFPLFIDGATSYVGIGTTTPNSKLNIAGPIATAIVNKTAAYTITATDSIITCDATSAAFTITLPTAVGIAGRQYTIKKIDSSANAITVDGNGTETIDGELTQSLATQYDSMTIVSNGANWYII